MRLNNLACRMSWPTLCPFDLSYHQHYGHNPSAYHIRSKPKSNLAVKHRLHDDVDRLTTNFRQLIDILALYLEEAWLTVITGILLTQPERRGYGKMFVLSKSHVRITVNCSNLHDMTNSITAISEVGVQLPE